MKVLLSISRIYTIKVTESSITKAFLPTEEISWSLILLYKEVYVIKGSLIGSTIRF